MGKLQHNETGFSGVEAVVVLLIIVVLSSTGYIVYKHRHSATTSSTAKTTQATSKRSRPSNPYAGWKNYSLTVEKLTFMYPSDWVVSNTTQPTATQDQVALTSPDGFAFMVADGVPSGGDPVPLVSDSPVAVQYIGQPDNFVFEWAQDYNTGGAPGISSTQVQSAILLTNPSDHTSSPLDQHATGPLDTTGADDGKHIQISGSFKSPLTLAQAQANSDFKDARLIVQSMHY